MHRMSSSRYFGRGGFSEFFFPGSVACVNCFNPLVWLRMTFQLELELYYFPVGIDPLHVISMEYQLIAIAKL